MEDLDADNRSNWTNLTCSCEDDVNFAVPLLYRQIVGSLIFVIVWPFIAFDVQKYYPLSRPAAALIGATFMVMFLLIPIHQAFDVIGDKGNLQTICLLIGMMLLSYYYDREGLLRIIALWIFGNNKPFRHILWKVCVGSAVLSAIITNDATCIVITPLILSEHMKQERSKKEYAPLLIGIATSANIGSAATFFGNPQNAFIAANSQGEVSLLTFFATGLPAAILGMCLSLAILYGIYFRVIFSKPRAGNGEEGHAETELPPDRLGVLTPQIVLDHGDSIAISREELARSYDHSEHPHTSSQMARERARLYQTDSTSGSIPASRSRYSLPGNKYGALETDFSFKASVSNPNLSYYQSSGTDRSGMSGATSPRMMSPRSTRRNYTHSPIARGMARNDSIERVGSPLPDLPEDRTISGEHTDEEEEEKVVEVTSIWNRTWQSKLFIVWLIGITVVLVVLLAIPGPPTTSLDFNLGLVPLGCAILTMLVDTTLNKKYAYDAITKIDWPVILMFMGLFVWLQGFENTDFPDDAFNLIRDHMDLSTVQGVILFTVFITVGSNILSNVPLVIVIIEQIDNFRCGDRDETCSIRLVGVLLAWVSTVAGNFTLIGSVANLIVAEKARSCANYPLTFFEYLKFGFISTLVVLFAGLPIVYFAGNNISI